MFLKKPRSTTERKNGRARSFSVLGPDIVIGGDLTAQMDLHIDGSVKGDISCAQLVQGKASEVAGTVVAESARVAGTIRGSITAGMLVILKTARIEGDVTYGALTIEEGAQVDGKFTHGMAEPKLMLAGGTAAA